MQLEWPEANKSPLYRSFPWDLPDYILQGIHPPLAVLPIFSFRLVASIPMMLSWTWTSQYNHCLCVISRRQVISSLPQYSVLLWWPKIKMLVCACWIALISYTPCLPLIAAIQLCLETLPWLCICHGSHWLYEYLPSGHFLAQLSISIWTLSDRDLYCVLSSINQGVRSRRHVLPLVCHGGNEGCGCIFLVSACSLGTAGSRLTNVPVPY